MTQKLRRKLSSAPVARAKAGAAGDRTAHVLSPEELTKLFVAEIRDYAIFIIDLDNKIRLWNGGAQKLLGYREEEVIGRPGSIIFTPEDRAAGAVEQEESTARRTGRAEDERWHVKKDGQRFWGSGVMTAIKDHRGRVVALAKIMRDRTEQKRLTDQVTALNATLEQRVATRTAELLEQQTRLRSLALEITNAEQRARDSLAADLHDNLAQNLAACLMKLGVAGQAFPPNRKPREFGEAVNALEDVLRQTRMMMYSLSPMIIAESQLSSAIEWVRQQMARHDLEVSVSDDGKTRKLPEDVLRVVYRAAQELLWNVVKHARTNRATVTIRRSGERVRVTVSDHGKGFNPHRAQRATDKGGFGLFSLRERLAVLNGALHIHSARGKGTQVTIDVPVRKAK